MSQVKRILHVFLPCGVAGTETMIRVLIQRLASRGVESEAYYSRDIGGSSLFRATCVTHSDEERSLASVIREGRFDAIHATASSITLEVPEAIERAGFTGPVIVSCHGDYVVGWNRRIASTITSQTEWWKAKIQPYTDVPIEILRNPVVLDNFPPAAREGGRERPILGWVGHTTDARKGPELLQALMRTVPREAYDFYIADTDDAGDPRKVFGDLADRVVRYGYVPHREMPGFFQDIARSGGAVVSTSNSETFPLCLMEAMSTGCPVVVPDAWGAREMMDNGRAGLLYDPATAPDSILACLERLRDPQAWEHCVEEGRRVVRQYDADGVAERFLRICEEAASRPRPGGWLTHGSWALRSAGHYTRPLPEQMFLYRPRFAAEALERALRAHGAGQAAETRRALLDALRVFPVVYLKPWRAKFLLRTLLSSSHK